MNHRSDHRRERGSALVAVMLLVLCAAAFASLAASRSRDIVRDSLRDHGHAAALQAAEGGLAKARHALQKDPRWAGAELRIGTSDVIVQVERTAPDRCLITSRATTHPAGEGGLPVQVTLAQPF